MNFNKNDIRENILNQFKDLINEYRILNFDYSIEDKILYGSKSYFYIDLVVRINNLEFYFEFTRYFNSRVVGNFLSLSNQFLKNNRYFIIYTQNEGLQLKVDNLNFLKFENIFSLYKHIIAQNERVNLSNDKKEILQALIKSVVETFHIEFESSKTKKILNLLEADRFINDIKFDAINNYYYFINDVNESDNFENQFFDCLLDELEIGGKFYRYGDINLTFFTIKDGTCRFNGIPGMNDISEVGYLENYLDNNYLPFNSKSEIRSINNKFILCSSMLKDNLNQWRLYGDDCKGASIEFEVIERKNDFFIKKVSYGVEQNGNNYHFELELIKLIQEEFYAITGIELKFKTLDIWKHFFKSFEYSEEQEVRVLYINNGAESPEINWNLTYSHNILNPFVLFSLDQLPLRINVIYLGAKCPEKEINIKQFEYLSTLKGHNIKFEQSRIKNYR